MALKIYGVARSRAFRTLWMAKELGLDYEHVKVDFAAGETRTPAHLALNPNGAADDAEKQLTQPLQVLDGALGRTANLIGDNFTVADLNLASILSWALPAQIDLSPFPETAEWPKNCAERPAARAARQLQRE
jgi:glutathione S-transferase